MSLHIIGSWLIGVRLVHSWADTMTPPPNFVSFWRGGPNIAFKKIDPPSPSKFTPFCLEGSVQYKSLSADPRTFCVRGMFKIFVGKNCRICQLYWCFHQSICRKTRQRDQRNCRQHPERDLSKGDTVRWALQNRMFLGGQRDIKRWAYVWSRVVQICGVLPCLSYELLATPQGTCSARKRRV